MQATAALSANKAAVERLTTEFLNGGNERALDEIYAAGAIHHSPVGDLNVEARKMTRVGYTAAMPDFNVTLEAIVAEENQVAVHYNFSGTFTGELMMPDGHVVPGNNATIQMPILSIYRFDADGRVTESWESFDNLSLLAQMGVMPMSGG